MKHVVVLFFILFTTTSIAMAAPNAITGYIDKVTERTTDKATLIDGWACDQGQNKSVSVHLYVGGRASTGTILGSTLANRPSETQVANICKTTSIPHRFQLVVPFSKVLQFAGKSIFVHGISVSGNSNLLLNNSGRFLLPIPAQFQRLSLLTPESNGDLIIPSPYHIQIDKSIDVRDLKVRGRLYCPEYGNYSIKTTGIWVEGNTATLECGTTVKPFKGQMSIAVKAGVPLAGCMPPAIPCSDRNIMIKDGGTLRLISASENKIYHKLAKTALAGESSILLTGDVNWKIGDRVVIAPTGFDYLQADERIIKSISGRTITFTTPLQHRHHGILSSHVAGTKTWTIDERAEVANVSRNIHITSDGVIAQEKGAHIMVMKTAFAYIDGVELSKMGRMGDMARYPFHWHAAGDVAGQYIKNSSIRDSFQRCVTVHQTNSALVENNVCYNHFSHGFFLEDGNEINNTITKNLGILAKRPPIGRQLLQSDIDLSSPDRFPGPATFWVSNPQNRISNNIAAGSQGSGFWMSFSPRLFCDAFKCTPVAETQPAHITPSTLNTLEFNNNTARTTDVAYNWDGTASLIPTNNPNNPNDRTITTVRYSPATKPTFYNLKAFKSSRSATYLRANTMNFINMQFADNRTNMFAAFNMMLSDSVIVAMTNNFFPQEYEKIKYITGVNVYDGPFDMRRVDFINFNDLTTLPVGGLQPSPFRMVGASERYTNVVQGLRFFPNPKRRVVFSSLGDQKISGLSGTSIRDLDGSLTGAADTIVVPTEALMDQPGCQTFTDQSVGAMRCNYDLGVLFLRVYPDTDPSIRVVRNDGLSADTYANLHNKIPLILNSNYIYNIYASPDWDLSKLRVYFRTEMINVKTPIVAIHNLPKTNCRMEVGTAVTSLPALKNLDGTGYFNASGVLYVKGKTQTGNTKFANSEYVSVSHAYLEKIICP